MSRYAGNNVKLLVAQNWARNPKVFSPKVFVHPWDTMQVSEVEILFSIKLKGKVNRFVSALIWVSAS